jgi:hypothetical protein
MEKPPSKAQLRRQIEWQMTEYIDRGGEVLKVPRGISGREPGAGPLPPAYLAPTAPRPARTYVPEVVAAIEARRAPPPKTKTLRARRKTTPRKQFVYDDFGEPLRWHWVED